MPECTHAYHPSDERRFRNGLPVVCYWCHFAFDKNGIVKQPQTETFGFIGPCVHGRDPWDRCDVCQTVEQAQGKE